MRHCFEMQSIKLIRACVMPSVSDLLIFVTGADSADGQKLKQIFVTATRWGKLVQKSANTE